MTKPQITSQISLGNLLQIVVLLVAGAGVVFVLRAETEQHGARLADQQAQIARLEGRLRSVELAAAGSRAEFAAIKNTLDDLKEQQGDNNRLLRQILAAGRTQH